MFNSANFKLLLAALAVVFSVYACVLAGDNYLERSATTIVSG
jgi:hypothetical protein